MAATSRRLQRLRRHLHSSVGSKSAEDDVATPPPVQLSPCVTSTLHHLPLATLPTMCERLLAVALPHCVTGSTEEEELRKSVKDFLASPVSETLQLVRRARSCDIECG